MANARKNTKIANVITNEMKGEVAMAMAKEIVKKNIANATMEGEKKMAKKNSTKTATTNATVTMKGETTMATATMTATINTNTKLNGYEIRFSVAPNEVFRDRLGRAEKGSDKRRKHYNFGYYAHLGNAWIISQANITEKSLKALKKEITDLGYVITETTDAKTPNTKKSKKANGKKTVKAQAPKETPKAESKPTKKATKKADAILEVKTENGESVKFDKKTENLIVKFLKEQGYSVSAPKAEPKAEKKPEKAKATKAKATTTKKATKAKATTKKTAKAKTSKNETVTKAKSITVPEELTDLF